MALEDESVFRPTLFINRQTFQQRLAYLLGGSIELYKGSGHWTGAMAGVVFPAALLVMLLWLLSQLILS